MLVLLKMFLSVAAVSLDPAFSLSVRRSSALPLEDAEVHVRSVVSGTRQLHTSCKTSDCTLQWGIVATQFIVIFSLLNGILIQNIEIYSTQPMIS